MRGNRNLPIGKSLRECRLPLALVCLVMVSGCTTIQFKHDWRQTEREGCCGEDLEGLWEGTWVSHANDHGGKLQAIITKQNDDCYYVRFHSTFKLVIPFDYDVPLSVTKTEHGYQFEGRADLGFLAGGVYTTQGEADECHFRADYCAKKDHGVFCMRRVSTAVPCCRR